MGMYQACTFLRRTCVFVCVCTLWLSSTVKAQMQNPMMGQGPPPDKPKDVYVSALLEKLVEVDEVNYRFTAHFVLYLSWKDNRALPSALRSTEMYRNGTRDCIKPCFSDVPIRDDQTKVYDEYMCCDDVWLPTLSYGNAFELPEGRLEPYTIFLDPSGAVGWKMNLQAVFFTPMYFGNYPFDSQKLTMQFIYSHGKKTSTVERFIPSATATEWFQRGKGDVAAGWSIDNLKIETYNTR